MQTFFLAKFDDIRYSSGVDMVSLKDIASDVGVSVPLVSKVLNNRLGSTGASKKTIERIKLSAQRLGYRKNQAAAALRTGRQNVIGVFLHWLGEDGSGLIESIIKGIAAGCQGHRIRQQICFFETFEEFREIAAAATPGEMDGLIVAGTAHPESTEMMLEISRAGLPVVTAYGQNAIHKDIPNAGSDEVELCRLGIEHLIEQGCEKIAGVGPAGFRTDALIQVRQKLGLSEKLLPIYNTAEFDYASGTKTIAEMLAGGIEYDGIFAFSDQLAINVMHQLLRVGRTVPGDVKVVGVDNSPYCDFALVPLTSICGEDFRRGELAVDMIHRLRDGKTVESGLIPPRLVTRESSAR